MSHSGRVTSVDPVSDVMTGQSVIELRTDDPEKQSAVYVDPVGPVPAVGDLIEWGPHHIDWHRPDGAVQRIHKVDWAFDPDKALG